MVLTCSSEAFLDLQQACSFDIGSLLTSTPKQQMYALGSRILLQFWAYLDTVIHLLVVVESGFWNPKFPQSSCTGIPAEFPVNPYYDWNWEKCKESLRTELHIYLKWIWSSHPLLKECCMLLEGTGNANRIQDKETLFDVTASFMEYLCLSTSCTPKGPIILFCIPENELQCFSGWSKNYITLQYLAVME